MKSNNNIIYTNQKYREENNNGYMGEQKKTQQYNNVNNNIWIKARKIINNMDIWKYLKPYIWKASLHPITLKNEDNDNEEYNGNKAII